MATALKKGRAALLLTAAGCTASAAFAQVETQGGVQVNQTIAHSNFRGGETAGWLETTLYGQARFDLRRLKGQASANVSRRFEEFGDLPRNYSVSGVADITSELIDDTFFLRAGANAQDVTRDTRFGLGGLSDSVSANSVQLFSLYAEPSIQQRIGSEVTANASYRIGALFSDDTYRGGELPIGGGGGGGLGGGGLNRLGALGDSITQSANGRLQFGNEARRLRTGLIARWVREDIDRLDQEYSSYNLGATATYRVSRKLSLNAEGGYEDIENTQSSILFDPDTGRPVLGDDDDFIVDPDQPRITAFERNGPYGIVGFRYTPSRRTELSAFGGYRFGGTNFGGTLSYRPSPRVTVSGNVNRGLTSTARQLTQAQFGGIGVTPIDPVDGVDYSDLCPLGFDPVLGLCFGGLGGQPITSATFRNTSVRLSTSYKQERWSATGFVSYTDRDYLNSLQLQDENAPSLEGRNVSTESYSAGIQGGYDLNSGEALTGGLTYIHTSQFLGGGSNDQVVGTLGYRRNINSAFYATANATAAFRFGSTALSGSDNSYLGSVGIGYRF